MLYFLLVADLLLALGAVLRLTRFIVADDIPGRLWIKNPLWASATRNATNLQRREFHESRDPAALGWRGKILLGLGCPFCMSVWVSAGVLVSLVLAGGPGEVAHWWRWVAGFLTLAWLAGHIAALAGDTEE